MARYTNDPTPAASGGGGTNAALIILAIVIVGAIVVAAIYFVNGPAQTTNTSTTVDRTVSRIEQVPAQVGETVTNTVQTPDNAANPPAVTPETTPQPAPVEPTTTPQ